MAGCGNCPDTCNCAVVAGDNVLVTGTGSGSDPYVVASTEEPWSGTSPDGSIDVANLAPNDGHTPTLEVNVNPAGGLLTGAGGVQVKVDPASTAPVSLGANGLRVDCCDLGGAILAVDDTPTVDLNVAGSLLTANVKPNTLAGLENQVGGVSVKLEGDPAAIAPPGGNLARFTTLGDLTVPTSLVQGVIGSAVSDGSGVNATTLPAGAQVNLTTALGGFTADSVNIANANGGSRPLIMLIEGVAIFQANSSGGNVNRVFSHQAILEAIGLGGGAAVIGGAGLAAVSDFGNGPGVIAAGIYQRWKSEVSLAVYLPPGGAVTWRARAQCLENQVGWTSTVGAGAYFQLANIRRTVLPVKTGAGWGLI